ncbi:MAG: substrate-binding domain-containing protein [Anaerolineae bacterium]
MRHIQRVETFKAIKVLADGRRLAILRRLMAGPATLSQLGQAFGRHPAWVRHHLKQLEQVGLVEMTGTRVLPGFVERYYQATARAFVINTLIIPALPEEGAIVALGSHDLALELLARRLGESGKAPSLWTLPLGSLDGLIALRQGVAHCAGCHLLDTESDEYNVPYVTRLFPGQAMVLVTLAYRQQGLILAPGNPRRLCALEDIAHEGMTFVNRNRGSGTRIWLDRRLRQLGMQANQVRGYEHEVSTHTEVAAAIARGQADAGLGIQAAALAAGLDFLPLFQERYDLVIPMSFYEAPFLRPLLDELHSGIFRNQAQALGGYDISHCGEVMKLAG